MSCRERSSSRLRLPKPPVLRHPDHVAQLAMGQTEFAWKLYRACRSHPHLQVQHDSGGDTLCLSPVLLHQALCSGYAGARRQSAASLRSVLQLQSNDAELSLAYADISRALQAAAVPQMSAALPQVHPARLPHELHVASRLFLPITHCLLDQYGVSLRSAYASDLAKLPFHTDRERARVEINQWAEESTEQRVKELLRPLALPATFVSMVLASVLYFRGAFAKRVRTNARVEPGLFRGVNVPCVRLDAVLRWGTLEEADALLVELPYEDERFSLLIIVPNRSLEATEAALGGAMLARLDEALQQRSKLRLRLPVFTAGQPLSLGTVLKESEAGLATLFARGMADFSGVSGNNNLHLSHVEHVARFELDTNDFRRKSVVAAPPPADKKKEKTEIKVKETKEKKETQEKKEAKEKKEKQDAKDKKESKEKKTKSKKDAAAVVSENKDNTQNQDGIHNKNEVQNKDDVQKKDGVQNNDGVHSKDGVQNKDGATQKDDVNNANNTNQCHRVNSNQDGDGVIGSSSPLPPSRKMSKSRFEVDEPFLFLVLDNYLRMLLLMGCVRDVPVSKPPD